MTGDFPQNPVQPCPSCGHCPTCGRGPQYNYFGPYWSVIPPTGIIPFIPCSTTTTLGDTKVNLE